MSSRLSIEARRAQLLDLGRRFFSERPYEEVTVTEIAAEAGISTGLLYHYFASKRELYVATVRAEADSLLQLTAPDPSLRARERLVAGLEAYLRHFEEHAAAYAMLYRGGHGLDQEIQQILDETRTVMVERLLDGLEVERPSPALSLALRGWIGFVERACLEWGEIGGLQRSEFALLLGQTLEGALRGAEMLQATKPSAAPRSKAGRAKKTTQRRATDRSGGTSTGSRKGPTQARRRGSSQR